MAIVSDIITVLKEAANEIKATENHEDGYPVPTHNFTLLSSAISGLEIIESLQGPLVVEGYGFTEAEIARILSIGGTSTINKDGQRIVIPQLVKNIINQWNNYVNTLFTIVYSMTTNQINRISFRGVQIIYTTVRGNEYSITEPDQFRTLEDLV